MKKMSKILFLSFLTIGTIRPNRENSCFFFSVGTRVAIENDPNEFELAKALRLDFECKQAKAENKENTNSICEQFKQAENDVNIRLKNIAQLEYESEKLWEIYLGETGNALFQWTTSDEYKNCQVFLKKIENGTITEQEKDVVRDIMIQSDAYKRYKAAPDTERKAYVLHDSINQQLRNESKILKKIVNLRNREFESDIEQNLSKKRSEIKQEINTKFSIDYSLEEVFRILYLSDKDQDAFFQKKQATNTKTSAEDELKKSTVMKDYVEKKEAYLTQGLLTAEDLKIAWSKVKESAVWKKCESECEKFDKAEQKEKESSEQLINVLKAPYFRQNK